ncbi:MAG: transcriptional regulator, partial [Bacteroidaceae bacterium]
GRNQPSTDVVTRIHQRFPFVNLSWLLTGEGDMCITKASDFPSDLFQNGENASDSSMNAGSEEYRKEKALQSLDNRTESPVIETVKYIEMPKRNITEIRIFFDDNTFEIFKPEPQ